MDGNYLQYIRDRQHMTDYFDGYTLDRMEELEGKELKKPLVKSYLLEFLNGKKTCTDSDLENTFGFLVANGHKATFSI